MKKLLGLSIGLGMMFSVSQSVYAYGTGISTFPLETDKKLISAEITGITSNGGGLGLQTRFTQKLNERSTVDAGLGISGGERSARLFAGYDFEIIPDYESQPRVSLKAFLENSKEFDKRRNILGLTPTVSKGFSFWGKEAFPYLSVPYGISLDGTSNSYNTTISANLGVTGIIPSESDKKLTANAEVILGLKNSFSGVFMGVAYPIE
jgi:hypothetical protein